MLRFAIDSLFLWRDFGGRRQRGKLENLERSLAERSGGLARLVVFWYLVSSGLVGIAYTRLDQLVALNTGGPAAAAERKMYGGGRHSLFYLLKLNAIPLCTKTDHYFNLHTLSRAVACALPVLPVLLGAIVLAASLE